MKQINLRIVLFFILWLIYFLFGMEIASNLMVDGLPIDLHGYDSRGHAEMLALGRFGWITCMRHPLLEIFFYPASMVSRAAGAFSPSLFYPAVVFIFSGFVAGSVMLVYSIVVSMDGVSRRTAIACTAVFATFGYLRYLSSIAESFAPSMFISLLVLRRCQKGIVPVSGRDTFVWGALFFTSAGLTITQGAKTAFAYILSHRLSRKQCWLLLWTIGTLIFFGSGYYFIRLVVLKSGGRGLDDALATLFQFVPKDLSWAQRFRMLEMFFFEPIIPHGVPYSQSEITTGYISPIPYLVCTSLYISSIVGIWRLRHTRFICIIAAMFSVDILIHFIFFWGMTDAQIFCAHWFYVIPIFTAASLARKNMI